MLIDLDSAKIIKADTTIENVPIRTVVIGDAYVERTKSTKPQTLVCIIGDKGKVLLDAVLRQVIMPPHDSARLLRAELRSRPRRQARGSPLRDAPAR